MNRFDNIQSMIRKMLHNMEDYLKKSISNEDNRIRLEELVGVLMEMYTELDKLKKLVKNGHMEYSVSYLNKYLIDIISSLRQISEFSRDFNKKNMRSISYNLIFAQTKKLKDILFVLQTRFGNVNNISNSIIKKLENMQQDIKDKQENINAIYSKASKDFVENDEKKEMIDEESGKAFNIYYPYISKNNLTKNFFSIGNLNFGFNRFVLFHYSIFWVLFIFSIFWIISGVLCFYKINYSLIVNISDFEFLKTFISSNNMESVKILKDILRISFIYKLPFFIFCVSPAFILLNEAYKQKNKNAFSSLRRETYIKIREFLEHISDDRNKDKVIGILVEYLASNLSNNKKDILSSKDLKKVLKLLEQVKVSVDCCGCLPKPNLQSEN